MEFQCFIFLHRYPSSVIWWAHSTMPIVGKRSLRANDSGQANGWAKISYGGDGGEDDDDDSHSVAREYRKRLLLLYSFCFYWSIGRLCTDPKMILAPFIICRPVWMQCIVICTHTRGESDRWNNTSVS